ncbi:hypothetical protein [Aeromonas veronii]|uniref:hypothetical protein n=1 Tax=Aeromonas TaxID=642 RepID=UPI0021D88293|nr:hypothetical protein [Aeromonas veronii]UYB72581.1 hypothetical protein NBH81_09015 [Aeromonas veronii]
MTGKIDGLTVLKEGVRYHQWISGIQPPLEGVSLPILADIALRSNKYLHFLRRTQGIELYKGGDNEGFPIVQSTNLRYFNKEKVDKPLAVTGMRNFNLTELLPRNPVAEILIYFHDTDGDDYDYIAQEYKVQRGTDYKSGPASGPFDMKFKIYQVNIKRPEGDVAEWLQGEVVRLKNTLDGLDHDTQSLRSWAEAGINMRVICGGSQCCPVGLVESRELLVLANKGLSLDDVRQKLKCKACGARCRDILPV